MHRGSAWGLAFLLSVSSISNPVAAEGEDNNLVPVAPVAESSASPAPSASATEESAVPASPVPESASPEGFASASPSAEDVPSESPAAETSAPDTSETAEPVPTVTGEPTSSETNLVVSREEGTATFTISGLTEGVTQKVTVEAADSSTGDVKWQKDFETDSTELTGQFTLEDVGYTYGTYAITIKVNGVAVGEPQTCDFSIHTKKMDLSVLGETSDSKRTFRLNSTEPSGGVLVPGKGNMVSVYVWQGKSEKNAEQLGTAQEIQGSGLKWENTDVSSVKSAAYGTWNAKLVLQNSNAENAPVITLASAEYNVEPSVGSFAVKKTTALEKAQMFRVQLKGLKNVYPVKKTAFQIYNSADKKIATVDAQKNGSSYTADVEYKTVNYKLEKLTIKAVVYDKKGKNVTLTKTAEVDLSVKNGTMKVKPHKDATCDFTLKGAYVPGNISQVKFVVYLKQGNKLVKQDTYITKEAIAGKKNKYVQSIDLKATGEYTVYTYAYTAWDKWVQLSATEYEIEQSNLGKQGWVYEKVNGKKYKFYYVDNKKVTDLTKILNLTPNGSNKMYIEVNRAAAVVTFYAYDSETQSYDIPIRSATVSVGRDVQTVAGASALNINSSFTPIGTYSVCSNGAAVRYSLKPMHEPDGSTVYARWCTHIVGNVYFHAIAVHSQSHYALSSYSYNRLGGPASAGCIRMTVADAKWLYDYAPTGTQVKIVTGSTSDPGPYGKPATITISGVSYDPTDPEVPDSQKKQDYAAGKISGYMTKDGEKVGY